MKDRDELLALADGLELADWSGAPIGNKVMLAGAITHLRLAAQSPEPVTVKPLEWSKAPNGCYGKGAGYTYVCFSHRRICVDLDGHGFIAWCDTYEEAQSVAQADYEARIRSALVNAPVPTRRSAMRRLRNSSESLTR